MTLATLTPSSLNLHSTSHDIFHLSIHHFVCNKFHHGHLIQNPFPSYGLEQDGKHQALYDRIRRHISTITNILSCVQQYLFSIQRCYRESA
eukprot:7224161-Ditylum_brightwellii.AAC.1